MIFDILPGDPVTPFQTGNTMQIIIIALFAGIGIVAIGERGNNIRTLIDEWSVLMRTIVSTICSFIPLYVFVMLLSQIWHGSTEIIFSVWKPLVITVVIVLIMAILFWLLTSVLVKCPPICVNS
ncbi:cation:dicarboxylate symporter family transporter [Oribacterium sp. WCC10]|uniref:cation:dicarboxylate symporter family transporter n=1 Tax=Oribacterium sp. WCC10 TaxID=1855343 RepID=UPI003FA53CB2